MSIVCGIASIPSRFSQLINTVNSLLPQVDKINLSLNNYTAIPQELIHPKIEIEITQGTDEQKFRKVEGDIYLSVDDDLVFPYNYVAVIRNAFEEIDRMNFHLSALNSEIAIPILTFHGRSFDILPINSYYKSKSRRYRCLDKVAQDMPVQIGGTGCMAFITSTFSLTLKDFQYRYMADIQVALKARREGKKIICLAHESDWIKYQQVGNTIFDRFKDDDKLQTQLINSNFVKETV